MTFADKYEILEAVGRGRVETFVARKASTDQQVLIYVFEGRGQKPEEPTVQWVLESFRALAPSPPELVVETGRYNSTSYAYLVTKLPERAALQEWLRAYEAQPEAARKSQMSPEGAPSADAIHTGEQTSSSETPPSEQSTPLPTTHQPEEITKVFEALRAKLKPQIEAEPAEDANGGASGAFSVSATGMDVAPSAKVKRSPGKFTMEFLSGFDHEKQAGDDLSSARDATPTQVLGLSTGQLFTYSADGKILERRQDSITEIDGGKLAKTDMRSDTAEIADLLGSSSTRPETKPPHTASPEIASAKPDAGSAGEFTNFFRGPFDGEKPSPTPELSLPVSKPEQTGDFARIFGRKAGGSTGRDETRVFSSASPANAHEGTFTKLFDSPDSVAKSSAGYEPEPEIREGVEKRDPRLSGATDWLSPMPVPSPSHSAAYNSVPNRDSTSNLLDGSEASGTSQYDAEGATRVFSVPTNDPTPDLSSVPAGPSEYTRIISSGAKPPVPSQEPPAVPGAQKGPLANVSVPPLPSAPQVPQVGGYPHIPASPQAANIVEGGCYRAPSPAEFPIPGAPQPGQGGSATPKATGVPWAMILILNGLFVLAVLLVLYFALKH